MEEVMWAVCADFECELVEFNGEDDHVHLLVNFPPKAAVTKLVNSLKGVSSRRLRLGVPPGRRLGESSPTWYATTGGPTISGPAPTSPAPSAAPHSP
jgi:putative transposase